MGRWSWVVMTLIAVHLPVMATTYYVDGATGSDAANGRSSQTAWKHAPGDPKATQQAVSVRLKPGDAVLFRGGVPYRGSIRISDDGAPGRPITFASYGTGMGIIDGAEPVDKVSPCPSAAACGGADRWRQLSLITYAVPPTSLIKLYDADGPLFEAQFPAPREPFFSDGLEDYAVSRLADKSMIESGRLRDGDLVKLINERAGGTLSLWVAGNQVVRRTITGVEGDIIKFDPLGLRLYEDRDGRYALIGTSAILSSPGQYVVLGPGKAVAWLRGDGGELLLGQGRVGFEIAGHSHIAISGLTFRHHTAAPNQTREGLPIVQRGGTAQDLVVTGNRFQRMALWNGQGVINLHSAHGVRISDNEVDTIERGSGIRAGGDVIDLTVSGNLIRRIGRTAVAFLGVQNGVIDSNVIEGLRGLHGNGISLYLNNRRVNVIGNLVTGTTRPMTYHGDKSTMAPGDHEFLIERNIFLATDKSQAAITSWGSKTRNVIIRQNVATARKTGMLLDSSDTQVTVTQNLISGLIIKNRNSVNWQVKDNDYIDPYLGRNLPSLLFLCKKLGIGNGVKLGAHSCN